MNIIEAELRTRDFEKSDVPSGTPGGFPIAPGTPSASDSKVSPLKKLKWNPESLIAPFEPRLNWERRELHAHDGDAGWASRLISAVLDDLGFRTEERACGVFGFPKKRKPAVWLSAFAEGHSAETAMLLCAARALSSEEPDAPAGFAFLKEVCELPGQTVILETSEELPAGRILAEGIPKEQESAFSACPAKVQFTEKKGRGITIMTGTGGVRRFERDLTLLPAGVCAVLIPALFAIQNGS